jgi:hypothetical protein
MVSKLSAKYGFDGKEALLSLCGQELFFDNEENVVLNESTKSKNVRVNKAAKLGVSSLTRIKQEDIHLFFGPSARGKNDDTNDKREEMLVMISNNRVPQEFIEAEPLWGQISTNLNKCLDNRLKDEKISLAIVNHYEYRRAGGRGKHHDIDLIGDCKVLLKLEFKYGACEVSETPQFVSPMKPSQYMNISFEEFFYEHYLPKIVEGVGLTVPKKDIYMKQIHSNKPESLLEIQNKYYAGCKNSKSQYTGNAEDIEFYTRCKEVSKCAITKFIEQDGLVLDTDALTKYFLETQDKVYILCKDGEFRSQRIATREFVIKTCVTEPANFRFIVTTETGKKLYILLRWKNGNGVAFPAFQIGLK